MPKYGKALHLVPADLSAPNLRHQTPAPALQQLAQRPGMHRGDLQSSQPWVHTLPSPRLWQSHLAAVPVPFQVLVPARGAQGCCDPALQPPWAAAWGCSQQACSVCCRWIAQLWGSGKQLLPHTCQQGELSRDLLCCKGLGAAAWPSTLQGSSQGCSSALLGGAGQCEPAQVSELAVPHRMSPRLCPACGRQGR